MKNTNKKGTVSVRHLTTAAIIAALYVVFTGLSAALGLASGAIQVRLSEALTVLPYFTPAAVPGVTVGCLLANLLTPVGPWDIFGGSLITLIAAFLTFLIGKFIKNTPLKLILGGIFPVFLNSLGIPLIIIFAGGVKLSYPFLVFSMTLTQLAWVYGLGVPLYLGINSLKKRQISAFE